MKINTNHFIFSFDSSHPAIEHVQPGQAFTIETCDCFTDTITNEKQLLMDLDFNRINPATGPLYIDGAQPGDVLKVEIGKIHVADQAIMLVSPGQGFLGDQVEQAETRIFDIRDNQVEMFGLELPLTKMIGVIGTAPADESISTGTPGEHGGNMDCTLIGEGATLYLPVNVPGALLALGDLHALMGDGEISVSGAEVAGEVELTVDVIKEDLPPTPSVLTKDVFATISSAETMELAGKGASNKMIDFIIKKSNLSFNEAYMLLSATGKLAVCQVVDPLVTMRMELPRNIFEHLIK